MKAPWGVGGLIPKQFAHRRCMGSACTKCVPIAICRGLKGTKNSPDPDNMGIFGILRSRLICRYLCHFCKSNSLAAKDVNANLIYLTTESGSLFEGSSGKEELSCSIPGGVALIRSVF